MSGPPVFPTGSVHVPDDLNEMASRPFKYTDGSQNKLLQQQEKYKIRPPVQKFIFCTYRAEVHLSMLICSYVSISHRIGGNRKDLYYRRT